MGGLLDDLDKRRGQVEITQENRARLAQSYGYMTSTGQGTLQFPDVIAFGLTFIERPFVAYAPVVDMEAIADMLGTDVEATPLPHCSGFVTHFDQDENDFWVGAWVAVKVSFDNVDIVDVEDLYGALPVIEHHFTFRGIAMKDIPLDVEDSAND